MDTKMPDMSVMALFAEADIFVKGIMLLLLGLSVITWTIWFSKSRQMASLTKKSRRFEEAFLAGDDLESLYAGSSPEKADHPMAKVFIVGIQEWQESQKQAESSEVLRAGAINRVRRRMDATLTRDLEQCEAGLPFLATVASISPFVGLLGTVWGIMNSFQSIAAVKNTSLAVVAPHIAEALLATAIGLFAAIPATVAYNRLSSQLGRYSGRLEAFALEFISILERREEETTGRRKKIKSVS